MVVNHTHQAGGEVTNQHVVRGLGNGLVKSHMFAQFDREDAACGA